MASQIPDSPDRPRRVTAQMVAQAAGVSRSAVSRAFTEGAYLDQAKRDRIHQVAAELGYRPNALAAGLQGGRSHLVAIFVGNMRSPYDTAFVSQLVKELNQLNKWPILIDGGGDRSGAGIEEVLRYPLDALIVRGGSMSEDLVARCTKFGIPMICSGRPVTAPGVDNVCCRNALGTLQATELLLAKGRRRFGFISGPGSFYSSAQRREGMLRALQAAGLSLVAEAQGDYSVDAGHETARDLLATQNLDALICANDAMAIGALSAAREMGIAVPDQMSLVGFDDIAMAKWPMFRLTTLRNPIDLSVTRTIALLERRLANPEAPAKIELVDPHLVLRDTH
ncbi:MAG: LacI family DNA-binding transcriptional regulator [Pelagimonas sp.]|jgi:DNA-binding LacI/PurR family transcriptional regulator|nr:LacI family DNA-binding transcriptional regulator [Pelagimonas sp.]